VQPSEVVVERFSLFLARWLAAIHDALLPRLISGELRIGEAERMAEETVPG
jgi:hypothetical protein